MEQFGFILFLLQPNNIITEELDIQPLEETDDEYLKEVSCPECGQHFKDNCPPDMDMDTQFECPSCNTMLSVSCNVTIEREYNIEEL